MDGRFGFTGLGGALVPDAAFGSGPASRHDGEVVAPDVCLDGVVGFARRRRAGVEDDLALVAAGQFALASLPVGDSGLVHHHHGHADEVAVAGDLVARHADAVRLPVGGRDGLGGVVVGDRAVREAGQGVGREDLALRPEDPDDGAVAHAVLVLGVHFLAGVQLDARTGDLGVGHEVSVPREPRLTEGDGVEQLHELFLGELRGPVFIDLREQLGTEDQPAAVGLDLGQI
ncbi:hypothetical protein D3C72_632490 [compost metagenome]